MGLSSWRLTWRDDFDRVLHSMNRPEWAALQRSGLASVPGRRAFVSASDRLDFDVVHSAYLMEQAALAVNEIEARPPREGPPSRNPPCRLAHPEEFAQGERLEGHLRKLARLRRDTAKVDCLPAIRRVQNGEIVLTNVAEQALA